jgi:hypothetical protein
MSKGNTFETELLQHIFQNADIALVGDATGLRGSSVAGSLYIALHTADPGEGGAQNTNEASYGSYQRVAVARSAAQWTVSGNQVQNINEILFPLGTSGAVSQNITHWSVGVSLSGAGKILYKGAFQTPLYSGDTIQPKISTLTITED